MIDCADDVCVCRLTKSSLVATTHSRGTPIYFAPEMLMNPYQVVQKKVIAQSSRKTDIYAFALLSWEVLTQNQVRPTVRRRHRPFSSSLCVVCL